MVGNMTVFCYFLVMLLQWLQWSSITHMYRFFFLFKKDVPRRDLNYFFIDYVYIFFLNARVHLSVVCWFSPNFSFLDF
jgi:hypothetical protein